VKYLDEYRDPEVARKLVAAIHAESKRPIRLMEVCGTHTVSIFRNGIRQLLPETIHLVSGPGCPVCVTATHEIDKAIELASSGAIVTTFGDLIRVPGSATSLGERKAKGADVRIVYSSFEALKLAQANPERKVVFLAVGFETTAPTIAATVREAKRLGVENFYVFIAHKIVPPAMAALLASGELKLDGFILPGHVTSIIGLAPYVPVAKQYGTPCVVCGFEPLDILQTILRLVQLINEGRPEVENLYRRGVSDEGNPKAREVMWEVFETGEAEWRGLGVIPGSGLVLREPYRRFDAATHFGLDAVPRAEDPRGCACGDILRGVKAPPECPLFRKACHPRRPIGPCMVSSEGTCSAYYRFAEA